MEAEEHPDNGVVERWFKWPLGTWSSDKHYKELGHWNCGSLDVGLEGLMMALLTRGLGWSTEEVLVFCAAVRPELRDPRINSYLSL